MAFAALLVAALALVFTIGSFWWLHARTGSLEAPRPRTYAFANRVHADLGPPLVRLRLPLAFFNTGAKALVVSDLRIVLDDEPTRRPFEWMTTRTALRADEQDGFAFPTPFAVAGRSTKEAIAEFGDDLGWSPSPRSPHRMRLQAKIHPTEAWRDVTAFEWWAPPSEEIMTKYIAHRNAPTQAETGPDTDARA